MDVYGKNLAPSRFPEQNWKLLSSAKSDELAEKGMDDLGQALDDYLVNIGNFDSGDYDAKNYMHHVLPALDYIKKSGERLELNSKTPKADKVSQSQAQLAKIMVSLFNLLHPYRRIFRWLNHFVEKMLLKLDKGEINQASKRKVVKMLAECFGDFSNKPYSHKLKPELLEDLQIIMKAQPIQAADNFLTAMEAVRSSSNLNNELSERVGAWQSLMHIIDADHCKDFSVEDIASKLKLRLNNDNKLEFSFDNAAYRTHRKLTIKGANFLKHFFKLVRGDLSLDIEKAPAE